MKLYLCILLVGLVAGCSDKKAIESQNARIEEQGKKIKNLIEVVDSQRSSLSNLLSVVSELNNSFNQGVMVQRMMATNYDERLVFLENGISNMFMSGTIRSNVRVKVPNLPGK